MLPALGSAALPARADEPIFHFIYTTDLLPKGQKEVEQWRTWRHQKAGGYYDQLENRTEFSYGVTDAFQLSGYLNQAGRKSLLRERTSAWVAISKTMVAAATRP